MDENRMLARFVLESMSKETKEAYIGFVRYGVDGLNGLTEDLIMRAGWLAEDLGKKPSELIALEIEAFFAEEFKEWRAVSTKPKGRAVSTKPKTKRRLKTKSLSLFEC